MNKKYNITNDKYIVSESGQVVLDKKVVKPKKITGTRLASILNKNPFNSPFMVWNEITKTCSEVFEDTIYTVAGKVIEAKQLEYLKNKYFLEIITPVDIYGKDVMSATYGDFFKEDPVFGGMWDSITDDTIIECKTTKRIEDWVNDIPEYYALQGALYAYLKGYDKCLFICNVLTDENYTDPNKYICKNDNTIIRQFRVSERYPNFKELIEIAKQWYHKYVDGGISPIPANTVDDVEILKALRTNVINVSTDEDLTNVLTRRFNLAKQIAEIKNKLKPLEDEAKKIDTEIKNNLQAKLNENPSDKYAVFENELYQYKLTKTHKTVVDTDKLKDDGIYDKYTKETTETRLTQKMIDGK